MAGGNDGNAVVVLVVEDDALVRLLAYDILSDAGYGVLEACDGLEALAILEVHHEVRAIFTDVNMPNLDGVALVKIVTERWPHIGIVVASGVAQAPEGCRFIRKPYTSGRVLQELSAAISRQSVHPGPMVRHSDTNAAFTPLAEPNK